MTVVTAKSVSVAAAVLAASLISLPAQAATCSAAASSLTAGNSFTCSVGELTFSNIVVTSLGNVVLGNLSPFLAGIENGLSLNYMASAPGDVGLSYDVTAAPGFLITDAYMDFTGTATGTSTANLSETLTNGSVLPQLTSPGSSTVTFAGVTFLHAIKDQADILGTSGTSQTSGLDNGFSVSPVPIPGAFFLFGSGLVGLVAVGRKRRAKKPLAIAAT
jgi:hypothetical protein